MNDLIVLDNQIKKEIIKKFLMDLLDEKRPLVLKNPHFEKYNQTYVFGFVEFFSIEQIEQFLNKYPNSIFNSYSIKEEFKKQIQSIVEKLT